MDAPPLIRPIAPPPPRPLVRLALFGDAASRASVCEGLEATARGEASGGFVGWWRAESAVRRYDLWCGDDQPREQDLRRARFDGVLLALRGDEDPDPETRRALFAAAAMGTRAMVVFLVGAGELDGATLDATERAVRIQGARLGWDGDAIVFVREAAAGDRAGHDRLRLSLDETLRDPAPTAHERYRMRVLDVFMIRGRGSVLAGEVLRGAVKVGDALRLGGSAPSRPVTVTGVEMIRRTNASEAALVDPVGLLVDVPASDPAAPGDMLCADAVLPVSAGWEVRFRPFPDAGGAEPGTSAVLLALPGLAVDARLSLGASVGRDGTWPGTLQTEITVSMFAGDRYLLSDEDGLRGAVEIVRVTNNLVVRL